jgi:predicted TIM-barrel fold metal-dependent hydrolase
LYPRGTVTPGGWTDRYLSDYPNFYADLSAGSGHNALTRDPDFTRRFLHRHQDKLIFGSDCSDTPGRGPICTGWTTIQTVRELAPSKAVERKLLCENARRVYKL